MRLKLLTMGLISMLLVASPLFSQDLNHQMQSLRWMLGTWHYEDTSASGDYQEKGIRVCQSIYDGDAIRCESKGQTGSGKSRTYAFQLRFNPLDSRYEMVAVFSDYPRVLLYTFQVKDSGNTVLFENDVWTKDGFVRLNRSRLSFDGDRSYVWEIFSAKSQGDESETPLFVDRGIKQDPPE